MNDKVKIITPIVGVAPDLKPEFTYNLIVDAAFSKKAIDIKILDVRGICSFTDFFVIATADNRVQQRAIADAILERMKKNKRQCYHIEGFSDSNWTLLDFADVVAHIFLGKARDFYGLERLWGDAQIIDFTKDDRCFVYKVEG